MKSLFYGIHLSKSFSKIEFWIFIFFLIRLTGITNPPLETGHNWRQVTGLMVARNFLETDANILYPRVDDNEGSTGIIGMEFPALNYLYFIAAKFFGYTHWYGRLINLIISSIGLLFFGKIVSRFFSSRVALASTLFLMASIWFSFSRKMMPDTFCISLMFAGIYYSIKYLEKGRVMYLLWYVLFATLAVLSKIPAGIYFALLIPLAFKKYNINRKVLLYSVTLIPLALTYIWYFIWNPHLSSEFGLWYNAGKSIPVGYGEIISNFGPVAKNFYFHAFSSYIIFVFFVAGLFLIINNQNKILLASFFSVGCVFIIYILKSGFYFYHHNYYIIPFVPIMALVAGYAISRVKKSWLFAFLIVIGVSESILNQQHDFFIKDSETYKLELESIADIVSMPSDLIAINGNQNPQQIYLSHRKGWNCNDDQISDSIYIREITRKGCRYLFVNTHTTSTTINKPVAFKNEHYTVYDLASE
jgi:uncharacterized membrane protein